MTREVMIGLLRDKLAGLPTKSAIEAEALLMDILKSYDEDINNAHGEMVEMHMKLGEAEQFIDSTIEAIIENALEEREDNEEIFCQGEAGSVECKVRQGCKHFVGNHTPAEQQLIESCGWFYDVEDCISGHEEQFKYFLNKE